MTEFKEFLKKYSNKHNISKSEALEHAVVKYTAEYYSVSDKEYFELKERYAND